MSVRFDDRGKYFTDVINKQAVPVTIQTTTHLMTGTVYILPTRRLLDEMNNASQFIAVTDVRIVGPKQSPTINFMALRVDKIVWIAPINPRPGGVDDQQ